MTKQENKLNLFVDANIWITFWASGAKNLNQLRKLSSDKKINLITTDHLRDEVYRNRDYHLLQSFIMKKNFGLPTKLKDLRIRNPSFLAGFSDYEEVSRGIEQFNATVEKADKQLEDMRKNLDKLKRSFLRSKKFKLPADKIFEAIFQSPIPISEGVFQRAHRRNLLDNPPAKGGGLGDCIHWEAVLEIVPEGQDLYFVSSDTDFKGLDDTNVKNTSKLHTFLQREWEYSKRSKVRFYNKIQSFIKDNNLGLSIDVGDLKLDNYTLLNPAFAKTAQILAEGNRRRAQSLVEMFGNLYTSPIQQRLIDIDLSFLSPLMRLQDRDDNTDKEQKPE